MSVYQGGPVVPARSGRSGSDVAVAVLLWIFVGWPMSWVLLFLVPPVGVLFGIGITVALIVYLATSSSRTSVASPSAVTPHHLVVRREVESLAYVNPVGGCGWCGSPSAHVSDAGDQVHPRHWHNAEIEERIRSKIRF